MRTDIAWLFVVLFVAAIVVIHAGTAMLIDRSNRAIVAGGLVGIGAGAMTIAVLVWGMM